MKRKCFDSIVHSETANFGPKIFYLKFLDKMFKLPFTLGGEKESHQDTKYDEKREVIY